MSETKGCLGWIAAAIGWFVLWGLCMSIGDAYKISPFGVLFMIVIGTLVIAGIGIYFYTSTQNKIYKKHNDRVKHIQEKYSLAFRKFVDEKIGSGVDVRDINKLSDLKMISQIGDREWQKNNSKLLAEQEILRQIAEKEKQDREKQEKEERRRLEIQRDLDNTKQELRQWKQEQKEFAQHCRSLYDSHLKNFGCYIYNINIDIDYVKTPEKFEIWQMFPHAYCLDETLDYTNFQGIKHYMESVKRGSCYLGEEEERKITSFINKLNEEDKTSVYICPLRNGWDSSSYSAALVTILGSLDNSIEVLEMSDILDIDDAKESEIIKWVNNVKRRVVVIDFITDNNQIEYICRDAIKKLKNKHPLITLISICKGYSKEEMEALIEEKRIKIAEEKKRAEEEAKAKKNLIEAVSLWDTLVGGLHYSYLFYYYPTTCDFEATEEEWSNRWIVWDFKNTPGKTSKSDHQEALEKAIPMLKNKLLTTFEADSLKYLTLVCIPASSQIKTQARYEEFSNRICGELGLINAYPHISVVTEKEERRSGGTSIDTNKLSIDEDFFKGKYVLLFDDVITRGDSMRTFKRKMESLGAIVVGGLSLGKTKHERPNSTPIIRYYEDLPF